MSNKELSITAHFQIFKLLAKGEQQIFKLLFPKLINFSDIGRLFQQYYDDYIDAKYLQSGDPAHGSGLLFCLCGMFEKQQFPREAAYHWRAKPPRGSRQL